MPLSIRTLFLLIVVLVCFAFVEKTSFGVIEPPRDLAVEEIYFQPSKGQVMVLATITSGVADTIVYIPSYYIELQINNVWMDSVAIPAEAFAGGSDCIAKYPCTGSCPPERPYCQYVGGTDCGCFASVPVSFGVFPLQEGDQITVTVDPEDVVSEWDEGNNALSVIYTGPIPTLTEWVLIVLALSVAGFFVWQLKRRKKAVVSVQ